MSHVEAHFEGLAQRTGALDREAGPAAALLGGPMGNHLQDGGGDLANRDVSMYSDCSHAERDTKARLAQYQSPPSTRFAERIVPADVPEMGNCDSEQIGSSNRYQTLPSTRFGEKTVSAEELTHDLAGITLSRVPEGYGKDYFGLESGPAQLSLLPADSPLRPALERGFNATSGGARILAIYENARPRQFDIFRFEADEMTYLLGHCTRLGPRALHNIFTNGFRCGSSGRLGPGIYLSDDFSKCFCYSFADAQGMGAVILTQCILGHSYTPRAQDKAYPRPPGYDSVFVTSGDSGDPETIEFSDGSKALYNVKPFVYETHNWSAGFLQNEYMVPEPKQCHPRFVVVYESARVRSLWSRQAPHSYHRARIIGGSAFAQPALAAAPAPALAAAAAAATITTTTATATATVPVTVQAPPAPVQQQSTGVGNFSFAALFNV